MYLMYFYAFMYFYTFVYLFRQFTNPFNKHNLPGVYRYFFVNIFAKFHYMFIANFA